MDDKALKKLEAAAEFEQRESEKAGEAVEKAREKVIKFTGLLAGVQADVDAAEQAASDQYERAAEAKSAHEAALAQYREEHDGEPVTAQAQAASVGIKGA